jgi:hypothetical protein
MNFISCQDRSNPNHQVKINRLGSKRNSGKCGKNTCRNPLTSLCMAFGGDTSHFSEFG